MRSSGRAAALLAALLTLAVFARTVGNGFVAIDDPRYVVRNPVVLQGLTAAGARWACTTFEASNWHPLTWLSHMLDVQLFGTNPRGHHLTSVLLHAAAAGLLVLAMTAMTGAADRALVAVLLVALHPQRVESVAWVAERKDVLAGFLLVLALLAWIGRLRRPSAGRYALALGLYALSLAANAGMPPSGRGALSALISKRHSPFQR